MTDLLYPLETLSSPEFHAFKHAVHRAVSNTTGFSVSDLKDDPDKQWCSYTILVPDAAGMCAGWGVIDYVVLNGPDTARLFLVVEDMLIDHAAILSGHLPAPGKGS